jgi:hypothetical protein
MPTETDICNYAGGKIGGFGETESASAFISSINGRDKVSAWCKLNFPRVRRKAISDLAAKKCPFRETLRFADLGGAIVAAERPELGAYDYAFNLPGNCIAVINQFDEDSIATRYQPADYVPAKTNINYQWETIASKDGTSPILVTNVLSNTAGTSAFISYVIDITNVNAFSEDLIECIAYLLASRVCPVVGRDIKTSDNMMLKYLEVAIPDARRANQTQFNNSARSITDYKGGRL